MTEWVKLRVHLADGKWSSNVVRARVVPDLCYELLLGMPFLRANHILIDAGKRSVVDKKTGYDLMKARRPVRGRQLRERSPGPKPRLALASVPQPVREKVVPIPRNKSQTLPKTRDPLENLSAPQTKGMQQAEVIAAIRERIEVLAAVETFNQLDGQAKEKFRDRFPAQLPKVAKLPKGIYHNIKLKDANKVMAARSYACPKKYREAWEILI